MERKKLFLLVGLVATTGLCFNENRYKIVLRQQGYTQFIQYDVGTLPLREITLCIWMKLYHNHGPQSVLTYFARGNNRIVKMWLDEEARYLMITIKGYAMPKVQLNLVPNVWNHFCFSYQSEYGAYALYLNGDLLQCEATEKLIGYTLPPGGSIIIGYGITLDGIPTGLTGEIYGVNMILTSTITINKTVGMNKLLYKNPIDKQLLSNHNTHMKYVILNELKDNETDIKYLQNKTAFQAANEKKFENHKYLQNLYNFDESKDFPLSKITLNKFNKEITNKETNTKQNMKHFKTKPTKGSFKTMSIKENHFGSTDISVTSLSEVPFGIQYEVPPSIPVPPRTTKKPSGFRKHDNSQLKQQISKNLDSPHEHIFPPARASNLQISSLDDHKILPFPVTHTEIKTDSLAQHVVPPPLSPDPISSKLKNANKQTNTSKTQDKKTIKKKSTKQNPYDVHPREILDYEVPPPANTDSKVYGQWTAFTHNGKISDFLKHMRYDFQRVPPTIPLITVSETFPYPPYKMTTNLFPYNINRRGFYKREAIRPEINVKIVKEHDIKTTILNDHSKIQVKNVNITHRGETDQKFQDQGVTQSGSFDSYDDDTFTRERSLFVELPFIKALKYYEPDLRSRHNSIKNDTHPAQTTKEIEYIKEQIPKTNYNNNTTDNHWNQHTEPTKYVFKQKLADTVATQMDLNVNTQKYENNFHRHVKIGNALNERFVIGTNTEQKKRSFEGGNELVPELNRYRSDIDKIDDKVPNSLMPSVCRNIDMLDLSTKNVERHKYSIASEFILQCLKDDFLDNSKFDYNPIFYINWHQTPVRLFGGATPVKELEICAVIKCETEFEPLK